MRKPRLKIRTKDEWGGLPTKPDAEEYLKVEVEHPATYVLMTPTSTRPCVALEDCSILMRNYQEYLMFRGLSDVPFNFLVGPGNVIFEGKGWHTNCIDLAEVESEEEDVWKSTSMADLPVEGFDRKMGGINKFKESLGLKEKEPPKKKDLAERLAEIEEEEQSSSCLYKRSDLFRKSIVIGLICDVYYESSIGIRAFKSAMKLVKYGVKKRYIDKKYELIMNFEPIFKIDKQLLDAFSNPYSFLMNPKLNHQKQLMMEYTKFLLEPKLG